MTRKLATPRDQKRADLSFSGGGGCGGGVNTKKSVISISSSKSLMTTFKNVPFY